jgi:hypothetical protein
MSYDMILVAGGPGFNHSSLETTAAKNLKRKIDR